MPYREADMIMRGVFFHAGVLGFDSQHPAALGNSRFKVLPHMLNESDVIDDHCSALLHIYIYISQPVNQSEV